MTTLFVLANVENWSDTLFNGMDIQGIDLQPQTNSSKAWAVYYIGFMLVGSFFIANMFAGIVCDSFEQE
jgi:hypothetical protein